jgi:hypothetical protein
MLSNSNSSNIHNTQYETLPASPDFHYVIGYIGKDKTKQFYNGARGVWNASAFANPANLKKVKSDSSIYIIPSSTS